VTYTNLLHEWWPWLRDEGFEPVPALHQWRRRTDFGFQNIVVSLMDLPNTDDQFIEVHCGLRFSAVEELVFPFTSAISSFRPNSLTLVAPLGKLSGSRPLRLLMESDNILDLETNLGCHLKGEGMLFFRHYRNLQALDSLLNSKPEVPCPLISNPVFRPFRGMAVGHLLQRPDLGELGKQYWRLLKNQPIPPHMLQRYERLNGYLQGIIQLN
jgi:hypothetical protein